MSLKIFYFFFVTYVSKKIPRCDKCFQIYQKLVLKNCVNKVFPFSHRTSKPRVVPAWPKRAMKEKENRERLGAESR